MAENINDDGQRQVLIRSLRQQLESLVRAGVDRVPASPPPVGGTVGREQVLVRLPRGPSFGDRPDVPDASDSDETPRDPQPAPRPPAPTPAAFKPAAPAISAESLPVPSLSVLFGSSQFDTPPVPACDRPAQLAALAAEVAVCCRCPHLAETRTQTVFGVGSPETRLMFIGEAPGADEDRLGEPFVGRAGQLLTDMITKGMGLTREQVYIANILKCRPPENRNPTPEETNNCFGYLEQQIAIVRPEFICLLGRVAAQAILNTTQPIGKLRGRWHRYRGIPSLATYHPSYLLRTPSAKKDAWEDLQILMKEMGLVRPGGKP